MSELRQYDKIRGIMEPKRTDDLKPSAFWFVGQERDWDVLWMIEPEDGGPYVGQFAIGMVLKDGEPRPDFTWVPECDIRVTEVVDRLTLATDG